MNLSISLSSLRAAQFAIDTGAQNLANANTEGYHRQRVTLEARSSQFISGHYIGRGVDTRSVDRIRNQVLEDSFTQSKSELSGIKLNLSVLSQIESEFLLGDGSIHQALGGFFGELTRLSANPNQSVARDAVINQATQITQQTKAIHNRLNDLSGRLESQIHAEVNILNGELAELSDLHKEIQIASVYSATPNDLLDKRDQLVNRITEKIDVLRFEQTGNGLGLSIGGSAITIGPVPPEFEVVKTETGQLAINFKSTDREIRFQSGSIAALMQSHNVSVPKYLGRLDTFAKSFIQEVDQAHAKGVGINGPFSLLRSSRMVNSASVPLNQAGLELPIQNGTLFVSLTDPSGDKRTFSIDVDPSTDSLNDIASKLDAIPDIRATVDSSSGELSVFAQPGFKFDFTGNLETTPELGSFTGSSIPKISGQYQGLVNRNLAVTVIGAGTVGSTPGLIARVTDVDTGATLIDLNIGEGYEVGSELDVKDGVKLSFGIGTVANGDSFSTPMVAESDSSSILSALGLNSFFDGSGANDIAVSQRILDNPNELATSKTGDWADTGNLQSLIALTDKRIVGELDMTFQDYLSDSTSTIGFEVKLQQRLELNIEGLNKQYEKEIDAVSGVDLNEELLTISQYQKQYEAAVQVIKTIDLMFGELMNVIR